MRFMGSRIAQPVVSACRKWVNRGTTFFGSEGWISVDPSAMFTSDPKLAEIHLKSGDVRLKLSEGQERDLINCIKTREETINPIESAMGSDAISHLSDLAIRTQRPIRWDPERERVIDDGDAAQRLKRFLRAPWNLDEPMVTEGWQA